MHTSSNTKKLNKFKQKYHVDLLGFPETLMMGCIRYNILEHSLKIDKNKLQTIFSQAEQALSDESGLHLSDSDRGDEKKNIQCSICFNKVSCKEIVDIKDASDNIEDIFVHRKSGGKSLTCSKIIDNKKMLVRGIHTSCGHTFHDICLRLWLSKGRQSTCPCCRRDIKELLHEIRFEKCSNYLSFWVILYREIQKCNMIFEQHFFSILERYYLFLNTKCKILINSHPLSKLNKNKATLLSSVINLYRDCLLLQYYCNVNIKCVEKLSKKADKVKSSNQRIFIMNYIEKKSFHVAIRSACGGLDILMKILCFIYNYLLKLNKFYNKNVWMLSFNLRLVMVSQINIKINGIEKSNQLKINEFNEIYELIMKSTEFDGLEPSEIIIKNIKFRNSIQTNQKQLRDKHYLRGENEYNIINLSSIINKYTLI